MKVLVVDDDVDLVDLLTYALHREGYSVVAAFDGETALEANATHHPDLVLLGVNLPVVTGLEVCRQIRTKARVPVILLAERTGDADVVEGLEAGADDYVAKPFSIRQLLIRMEAILRRYADDRARCRIREVSSGDLVLDLEGQLAVKNGEPIPLTRVEFSLLSRLLLNAGRVVPYATLLEEAYGLSEPGNSLLLKVHVTHLRRKLHLPPSGPGSIAAVPSVGYRLAKPVLTNSQRK